MRRILITGGSGFAGSHVLPAFRKAFTSAEILSVGRRANVNVPEGVSYEPLNLIDLAAVVRRVQTFQPTEVIHRAAEASIGRANASKFDAWRINFGALYNLIDALERTGRRCTFAFASSSEVYGNAFNENCPATERTTPQPMNAYAHSKWIGEQLLVKATEGTCIKPIVLRPFNHIGPGQDPAFVVASFARQIASIEVGLSPPVVEVGNLSTKRDFLDVSDVVEAYIKIFQYAKTLDSQSLFNICSGQPRSIESILMALRELSQVPLEIRVAPDRLRKAEVPLSFGDASCLQQLTGWAPKIDVTTSLARVLNDARTKLAAPKS